MYRFADVMMKVVGWMSLRVYAPLVGALGVLHDMMFSFYFRYNDYMYFPYKIYSWYNVKTLYDFVQIL